MRDLDQWDVEQDARRMQEAQIAAGLQAPEVEDDDDPDHGADCQCGCQEPLPDFGPVVYCPRCEFEHERDWCPLPEAMECYECPKVGAGPARYGKPAHAGAAPKRKVLGLGPVGGGPDPNQLYRLECGHLGM